MVVKKTLHIKSWTGRVRWSVYWSLDCQICTLYIIIDTKIKKGFLNKKERVKGFFIFMTIPSFKQVEANYGKKEPWEWDFSWIISFLIAWILNTVNIVLFFSIQTQNGCACCKYEEKNLQSEQLLILFKS